MEIQEKNVVLESFFFNKNKVDRMTYKDTILLFDRAIKEFKKILSNSVLARYIDLSDRAKYMIPSISVMGKNKSEELIPLMNITEKFSLAVLEDKSGLSQHIIINELCDMADRLNTSVDVKINAGLFFTDNTQAYLEYMIFLDYKKYSLDPIYYSDEKTIKYSRNDSSILASQMVSQYETVYKPFVDNPLTRKFITPVAKNANLRFFYVANTNKTTGLFTFISSGINESKVRSSYKDPLIGGYDIGMNIVCYLNDILRGTQFMTYLMYDDNRDLAIVLATRPHINIK